jgi:hypothetical protein
VPFAASCLYSVVKAWVLTRSSSAYSRRRSLRINPSVADAQTWWS